MYCHMMMCIREQGTCCSLLLCVVSVVCCCLHVMMTIVLNTIILYCFILRNPSSLPDFNLYTLYSRTRQPVDNTVKNNTLCTLYKMMHSPQLTLVLSFQLLHSQTFSLCTLCSSYPFLYFQRARPSHPGYMC